MPIFVWGSHDEFSLLSLFPRILTSFTEGIRPLPYFEEGLLFSQKPIFQSVNLPKKPFFLVRVEPFLRPSLWQALFSPMNKLLYTGFVILFFLFLINLVRNGPIKVELFSS